jgi:hypothetical protein
MTRRRRRRLSPGAWVGAALVLAGATASFRAAGAAAELDLRADELDAALAGESNALVRIDSLVFDVESPRRAREYRMTVVTILSVDGRDYGAVQVPYDRFRKLKSFDGRLLDAAGKKIRDLDDADISDFSNVDETSLYSDDRVRVGSLVHASYPYTVVYEYEIEHDGLISWPTWYPQKTSLPVERAVFVLRVPIGTEVRHRSLGIELEPVERVDRKRAESVWRAVALPYREEEEWGPAWSVQAPSILTAPAAFEIGGRSGSMSSWESFGRWYQDLHADRGTLPSDAFARVQEICRDAPDTQTKVARLYEYLQASTRYVSVQLGIGGWQAFEPKVVHAKGYGDCKALSNYMVAMLRAAGIDAFQALINAGTREQDILADFPSNQFNHVVVFVPLASDTIWLECTNSSIPVGYVGAFIDDRSALAITPDGGRLVRTPRSTAADNARVYRAHVRVDDKGGASATVTSVTTGVVRERVREAMRSGTAREREQWLEREIALSSFSISDIAFRDLDSARTQFQLDFQLEAPRVLSFSGERAFLTPNLLKDRSRVPPAMSERTQPVWLGSPWSEVDTLVYELPPGFSVESSPEPVHLETAFGRYDASIEEHGGNLHYRRHLSVDMDTIPADDYADFRSFLQAIAMSDHDKVALRK